MTKMALSTVVSPVPLVVGSANEDVAALFETKSESIRLEYSGAAQWQGGLSA